jgi:hypothetical protein
MTRRRPPAPGPGTLGASHRRVGSARHDASTVPEYTAFARQSIAHIYSPVVTLLYCRACHRGYFAPGAPGHQPSQTRTTRHSSVVSAVYSSTGYRNPRLVI